MEMLRNLIAESVRKSFSSRQTRKANSITAPQGKQGLCCVFKKLVVSCPSNRSHTSCFSQTVFRRLEGALEALEQEEEQRRDRAPAQCWELKKLNTNRVTIREVQDSRGAQRGSGGRQQRKKALELLLQGQVHFTETRLIIFFAAENGEALYNQQKQDLELTVAQIMSSLLQNSDLN